MEILSQEEIEVLLTSLTSDEQVEVLVSSPVEDSGDPSGADEQQHSDQLNRNDQRAGMERRNGGERRNGEERRLSDRRHQDLAIEALPLGQRRKDERRQFDRRVVEDRRLTGERRVEDRMRSVMQRCPDFGPWLKEKRLKANLTQKKAAEKAGMQPAQWSRLEKSLSGPSYDKVRDIAIALNADADEAYEAASLASPNILNGEKGSAHQTDIQRSEIRELLDKVETLSSDLRQLITLMEPLSRNINVIVFRNAVETRNGTDVSS